MPAFGKLIYTEKGSCLQLLINLSKFLSGYFWVCIRMMGGFSNTKRRFHDKVYVGWFKGPCHGQSSIGAATRKWIFFFINSSKRPKVLHRGYNSSIILVQQLPSTIIVIVNMAITCQWSPTQRGSMGHDLPRFATSSSYQLGLADGESPIDEFCMVLGGQPTPFCFYPLSRVTRNCETRRHQQLGI